MYKSDVEKFFKNKNLLLNFIAKKNVSTKTTNKYKNEKLIGEGKNIPIVKRKDSQIKAPNNKYSKKLPQNFFKPVKNFSTDSNSFAKLSFNNEQMPKNSDNNNVLIEYHDNKNDSSDVANSFFTEKFGQAVKDFQNYIFCASGDMNLNFSEIDKKFQWCIKTGNITGLLTLLSGIKIKIGEINDKSSNSDDHEEYNKAAVLKTIDDFVQKLNQSLRELILSLYEQNKNMSKEELKAQYKKFGAGQCQQIEKIVNSLLLYGSIIGSLNPYAALFGGRMSDYAKKHKHCLISFYIEGVTPASLIRQADLAIPLNGEQYADIKQFPTIVDYLQNFLSFIPFEINGKPTIYMHLGWGDKSEDVRAVEELLKKGFGCIGPHPEAMRQMGDKAEAKKIAEKVSVPTLPGIEVNVDDPNWFNHEFFQNPANYPMVFKDPNGGGGQNIKIVWNKEEAFETFNSFKKLNINKIVVEKYLEEAMHIEIQMLGKKAIAGRNCGSQVGNAKIIEESISPSSKLFKALAEAAERLAEAVNYDSAGTVEFLVVKAPETELGYEFYFLEMNTRLQVEHPVSEIQLKIDLVRAMIQLATQEIEEDKILEEITKNSEKLPHVIEARINFGELAVVNGKVQRQYAAGEIKHTLSMHDFGGLPFLRLIIGTALGDNFDISRINQQGYSLIVKGDSREEAIERLIHCLEILKKIDLGISTNVPLLLDVLRHKSFQNVDGDYHNKFVEKEVLTEFLKQQSENPEESLTLRI